MKAKRPYSTRIPELDEKIQKLLEAAGASKDRDLLQEMVITAVKIGEDGMDRGDMKMMNTAMKELRYALKVFYPYRQIRKVAIFGSARTPKETPEYRQAHEFSRGIAKEGWMVITGASSGIMRAGNEGASRAKSFGVNIRLPFEQEANPVIADDSKLINFKYFFTRKLIFIRESDATVLCPGGFGTHDEGYETLTLVQTGKTNPRPIVCLDPPGSTYWKSMREFMVKQLVKRRMIDAEDLDLLYFTHDAKTAVREVVQFYRNYHSLRYIRDRLVIRMRNTLSEKVLKNLNSSFKDVLKKGKFEQLRVPFPEEENEPGIQSFPRLVFYFDRRHFARLRHLINAINQA